MLKDDQGRKLYECKKCKATTPSPFLYKDNTCQWCRIDINKEEKRLNKFIDQINTCDCGSELYYYVDVDDHKERALCDTCEIVILVEAN